MQRLPQLALLAVCGAPLVPARADVLVVDDDGGPGVFTDLQAAADAASTGDILLVKDGNYGDLTLIDGLTVVVDNGQTATVTGLRVVGLPADRTVIVDGLRVRLPASAASAGVPEVLVQDCAGLVFLQGLDVALTSVGAGQELPSQQIVIRDSSRVRLVESLVGSTTMAGELPPADPQPALVVDNSRVNVHDCRLVGSDGQSAGVDPVTLLGKGALAGAPGILLTGNGAYLRVANSFVLGGRGGDGALTSSVGCVAPADGGDGVYIEGFAQSLVTASGALVGGQAGAPARDAETFLCPATADAGDPIGQAPSAGIGFQTFGEFRPNFFMDAVVREQSDLVITYQNVPDEPVLWAIGLDPAPILPLFLFPGVPLEVEPLTVVMLPALVGAQYGVGTLPAVGDVLPPGQGINLFHQIARPGPSGLLLGEFGTQVLLDSSF
ncbi:hypothetical protein [Engelhardtia mirabilis]|uniref:Right handed beta helix domain-containing protein n=1 Tax=Engelhardtia mirabilis TaxID=2528011 RepID=A0A518BDB0_9BACT|nr:hypothetical protein Pla133_00300 [Planctomycetes bacterium Pla133]QDU99294.1 hypothetical protein Pla86_00300 [Planctomycetes bacterium Pla86]